MKVLRFPLSRITLFFVLGVLFSSYIIIQPFIVFVFLFFALTLFIISFYFVKKQFIQSVYFGISTYLLSFLIGITSMVIHTETNRKNHYIYFITQTEKRHTLEVCIQEKWKNTSLNNRYIGQVKKVDDCESSGKIILNIKKEDLPYNIKVGTNIKIQGYVYKNKEISNPSLFDYGKYLENHQIYAQVYVDKRDLKISKSIHKNLGYYAAEFRERIITNLEKSNFGKEELAIVYALILGQQQEISKEVLQDYQYAGAVHILSVSGLHVGFILLFVTTILKPIPNTRNSAFLKLLLVLMSLWIFGFIAGLAPSILRSVTMFSFVAIGLFLKRSVNIYHTLLVSILVILLFNPNFLFDVGFQLSYIALFFIVWLQPLLASIWEPNNKLTKKFWDIITVSFAAQIGTFPLSVYYFHQFPGLFFVTNLIILPFMEFIMILGVIVVIMAYFNYVAVFSMKLLEWSIQLLNKVVNWVASFQDFVIQDISFNQYMLWSLYLLIIITVIWFKKPNYSRFKIVLTFVIVFQLVYMGSVVFHQKEKEFIIFNIRNTTLMTYRNGQDVVVFGNESVLRKAEENIVLKPYLTGNFSKIKEKKPSQNLLFYKDKKILILDSIAIYPDNLTPDVLVITHSPKLNLDRFLQSCKPQIVVADGSNFKSYVRSWKATCLKQKIPFHDTTEKGYYKL